MATLYVSYCAGFSAGKIVGPKGTAILTTNGVTSERTSSTPGATMAVIHSDTAHYVNVGPAGAVTAAQSTGVYVPANLTLGIALLPNYEVAAIEV